MKKTLRILDRLESAKRRRQFLAIAAAALEDCDSSLATFEIERPDLPEDAWQAPFLDLIRDEIETGLSRVRKLALRLADRILDNDPEASVRTLADLRNGQNSVAEKLDALAERIETEGDIRQIERIACKVRHVCTLRTVPVELLSEMQTVTGQVFTAVDHLDAGGNVPKANFTALRERLEAVADRVLECPAADA